MASSISCRGAGAEKCEEGEAAKGAKRMKAACGVESIHRVFILNAELDAMVDTASSVCANLLRLVEEEASPSPSPSPSPLSQMHSTPSPPGGGVDFAAIRALLSRRLVESSESSPASRSSPVCLSSRPEAVDAAPLEWRSDGGELCIGSPSEWRSDDARGDDGSSATDEDGALVLAMGTEVSQVKQEIKAAGDALADVKPRRDDARGDGGSSAADEDGALVLAMGTEVSQVKQEIEAAGDALADVKPRRAGLVDLRRHGVQHLLLTFEQIRKECIEQEEKQGKGKGKGEGEGERERRRPDLKAAAIMKQRGLWVNHHKAIGNIAGVHVGDCFNFRIQMLILGLHKQIRAGIDYITAKDSPFGISIATSVVISTEEYYRDDMDLGETVMYTGQGGMVKGGKKLEIAEDQKPIRGNDGLKNSHELRVPIRLIRGFKVKTGQSGVLYRYDGLYLVNDTKYEAGLSGNYVYRFLLRRMKNQPDLQIGAPDPPQATLAVEYPAPLASENPLQSEKSPQLLQMCFESSTEN